MVLTYEETKKLEDLKQKNKKEIIDLNRTDAIAEHTQKMQRLDKLLEIAKAGGTVKEE